MILDFTKNNLNKLLDLGARFDVVGLVDVEGGVMNGDPDDQARARRDPVTGRGIVSDVALKRIIRDNSQYLMANGFEAIHGKVLGHELYVAHRGVLNENNQRVYREAGVSAYSAAEVELADAELAELVPEGTPVEVPAGYTLSQKAEETGEEAKKGRAKNRAQAGAWVLAYDGSLDAEGRQGAFAAFEQIGRAARKAAEKLTKGAKARTLTDASLATLNKKLCEIYFDVRVFGAVATTGDSCGAVRGPFQFVQGMSIDPLDDPTQAITRVAITRVEDKTEKRQEMGRRNPTPYALYRFHAFYSPTLATRTGISVPDLKLFWSALANFGREQASSLRGHIAPAGLYVFVHNHAMGRAHAHELFDRIAVVRAEGVEAPRAFADYRVIVDGTGLPEGVSLVPLYVRPSRPATAAANGRPAVAAGAR